MSAKFGIVLTVIALFLVGAGFALQGEEKAGVANAVEVRINSTDAETQGVLPENAYTATPDVAAVLDQQGEDEEQAIIIASDPVIVEVTVTATMTAAGVDSPAASRRKLSGEARTSKIAGLLAKGNNDSSTAVEESPRAVAVAETEAAIAAARAREQVLLADVANAPAANAPVLTPQQPASAAVGGASVLNPARVVARGGLDEGTIINAVLETALNSELPGYVRARVVRNVYDSRTLSEVVIPQGSVLIGSYAEAEIGSQRAFVRFERLILPDGSFIELPRAPATDRAGAVGIPADVDTRFFEIFGSSLLVGIAGFALGGDDASGSFESGEKTIQGEAAGIAADTVEEIRNRRSGYPTILSVAAGERINVFVTQDIIIRT